MRLRWWFFCLGWLLVVAAPLPAQETPGGNVPAASYVAQSEESAPRAEPAQAIPAAAETATEADAAEGCCPDACSKHVAELNKKAAGAYKNPFYKNDFSYLLDPHYQDWHLGERLKRLSTPLGGVLDLGGQYRMRFHNEQNMRGLGPTGRDDTFLLHRTRLYANWELSPDFRVYVEYLDAVSNYEQFAPRPIEENRSDFINMFAEGTVWENAAGRLRARVGRQEYLYGTQRLVSPLDWSNTRRKFDGFSLLWQGELWDIDGFWTRPVPPDARNFDNPNNSQQFFGVYSAYKGFSNAALEFYYLNFSEDAGAVDFYFNTLGSRLAVDEGCWHLEAEAAYQFGEYGTATHSAGFYTIGLGRDLALIPRKPQLWVYFDWASGDSIQGNGFHHLFPLGHYYLGFMDLFGRRNIQTVNVLYKHNLTKKWRLLLWWYAFWLQRGDDVPYSVTMTPLVTTPGGSKYLGQELDLIVGYRISPRMDVLLGYSYFWAGDFWFTNPSATYRGDAHFTYIQWVTNF